MSEHLAPGARHHRNAEGVLNVLKRIKNNFPAGQKSQFTDKWLISADNKLNTDDKRTMSDDIG